MLFFSGLEDSLVPTTVNSTFSVTTWPPQMHWLHQNINLSSLTPEMLDGLILGDKLKVGISNYSNDIYEWVVTFIHDADVLNGHYYKHYANNTESMILCIPYITKLPIKEISRNYAVFCYNYTPGSMDILLRQGEWDYTWNTHKYPMSAMFTLAAGVFIAGFFGEI